MGLIEVISLAEFEGQIVPKQRHATFDVDGTLAITEWIHRNAHRRGIEEVLDRKLHTSEWDKISQKYGPADRDAYSSILRMFGDASILGAEFVSKFESETPESMTERKGRITLESLDRDIENVETVWGIGELLTVLQECDFLGHMAYCTGSSERFVDKLLTKQGMTEFFVGGIAAEVVPTGLGKPHPHPYLKAGKECLGEKQPGLCFENTAGGALAAAAAGGQAFLFATDNPLDVELRILNEKLTRGEHHLDYPDRGYHPIVYLPEGKDGWSVLADRIRREVV